MYNQTYLSMQNLNQRLDKHRTHQIKLIFIGSIDAGKSSLFRRIVDNQFDSQDSFVGVDFKMKYTKVDDHPVRLCYWDTAGQERFNSLSPKYYKDAHSILVCYDVNNPDQVNNLKFWVDTAEEKKEVNSEIIIVGCKKDMTKNKRIAEEKLDQKFNKYKQFDTSSKTGKGVKELEEYIMSTINLKEEGSQVEILADNLKTETKLKEASPMVGSSRQQQKEDKKCCGCCCC